MGLIEANGTTLYHERRGEGPVVSVRVGSDRRRRSLDGVADVLASAHTIVTYDRRGNSRSPRPPEWTATTIDEQADDAAALLGALDVEQTVVMGTSAAAGIVANLALRHDFLLRGVVIHEPLFQSVVTNADAVRAGRRAQIEAGLAKGGRRGATEAFLRYAAGETVYDSLDRALRERLLGNGEVLIGIEMGPYVAYEPTHATNSPTMRVSRRDRRSRQPPPQTPRGTGGTNPHSGSPPNSRPA